MRAAPAGMADCKPSRLNPATKGCRMASMAAGVNFGVPPPSLPQARKSHEAADASHNGAAICLVFLPVMRPIIRETSRMWTQCPVSR